MNPLAHRYPGVTIHAEKPRCKFLTSKYFFTKNTQHTVCDGMVHIFTSQELFGTSRRNVRTVYWVAYYTNVYREPFAPTFECWTSDNIFAQNAFAYYLKK